MYSLSTREGIEELLSAPFMFIKLSDIFCCCNFRDTSRSTFPYLLRRDWLHISILLQPLNHLCVNINVLILVPLAESRDVTETKELHDIHVAIF